MSACKQYLMYSALIEPNPFSLFTEHLHQDLVPPPQPDVGVTESALLQVLLEGGVLDDVSLLRVGEGMAGGGT